MRDYLKDINIVQAMLVFREGDLLDQSIPSFLKYADKIIIMLDNSDEYTENKVMSYKLKYQDRIIVNQSEFYKLESSPEKMNSRFCKLEGKIRNSLLDSVRNENN